jgi:hypothetical protein
MSVPIVAFSKECLYEEMSLQMDTMFHNTPLWTFEHMYLWCQNSSKNTVGKIWGVYSYNLSKTQWEKWRFSFLICYEKTPITQWNKLGETLSTYIMSFTSLLWKPLWENQEIDIFLCAHCLVKNLSWEIVIKLIKEKSTMWCILTGSIREVLPPEPCKSLSLLIPMSLTHLSNIAKGNDFVNKYAWLSQDFICKTLITNISKLVSIK